MSVNNLSKEYQKNIRRWNVVRDCVEGQEAIYAGGVKYLPQPSGQSKEDYAQYRGRAVFFDGTSRTAEGLHGHIFAKDPVQAGEGKISDEFKELLKNVDASGASLDEFASSITWDALQTNFGGVLVDYPQVEPGTSLADDKGSAYLKWYTAESIYNYRYSVVGGTRKLSLVVFREDIEECDPLDEFNTVSIEAYRVLSFDKDNYYIQRVFKKDKSEKDGFTASEPIYPKINGECLDFIPFYTCPGEQPEKSMLLGLAYENIGHYQKTAEYENGLFYTGIPTPIAENMEAPFKEEEQKIIKDGVKETKKIKVSQKVSLGGSSFKFFCQKNPDGTVVNVNVKYLEFTGAGLTHLLNALNNCLDRMAKLGIQAIGAERKGVETAETAKIHRASEHGVLGAFARSVSDVITKAVRLMAKWNRVPEEEADSWSYQLNTDFNYSELSAQILSIMHSARQSDEIPRSVWFTALKKQGMVPENMAYDDFLKEIVSDNTGGHGPGGDD
jgi:hypothetical protein